MADEQFSELTHQWGVSVGLVHLLEYLKNAGWFPWLTQNSTTVLRIVSVTVALLTTAGFKVLSGNSDNGWTIAIPPLSVILDVILHTLGQWGAQHGYYNLLKVVKAISNGTNGANPMPPKSRKNLFGDAHDPLPGIGEQQKP